MSGQLPRGLEAGTGSGVGSAPRPNHPGRDDLWKQYELHVDLYKHYLELIIKLNALHYAITGAILSFYFSMAGSGAIRWSLLLPIGMSFGMAGIFIWGGFGNLVTRKT